VYAKKSAQQQQPGAESAQAAPGGAGASHAPHDESVVDAEFEEVDDKKK